MSYVTTRAYHYRVCSFFFFFQAEDGIRDVAVTGVQTCALPISHRVRARGARHPAPPASGQHRGAVRGGRGRGRRGSRSRRREADPAAPRSEEHTSELQSRLHLVCRLLLEKKKTNPYLVLPRLNQP